MSVRDDLVLVGWLSAVAPVSAGLRGAGLLATRAIRGVFPTPGALDDALANALRRAAATAVLQYPERVDPIEGQRAILADRGGFSGMLDREEPVVVALAARLDALPPTRGVGARLAPAVLETFAVQAADLFPRPDMGGIELAIGVLERLGTDAVAPELAGLRGRVGPGGAAPSGQPDLVHALHVADLPPADRIPLLRDAIARAERAGDRAGRLEGLEELSRAYAEDGRIEAAVAALGDVCEGCREAADAAGEARALQIAGRVLCEAPAGRDDPGAGLVLLLHAADIAGSVDPLLADLIRGYVTGFQYTLDDRAFARIEPLLDRNREEVVRETFARHRRLRPEGLA